MKSIFINIHEIKINLSTDNHEFYDFVQKDLYYFLDNVNSEHTQIDVNIYFNKSIKNIELNKYEKIGANAYKNNNNLIFNDNKFDVCVSLENNKILIDAFIKNDKSKKILLKSFIKRLLGKSIDGNHYLLHVLRKFIIFPTFYYLESFKSSYVMHASAFTYKSKCFVLAGLANIGKSTNSLVSTFDLEGKFLSDNYLIYDEKKVYSFPELLRVSDETKNMIENKGKLGVHKYTRAHRKLYEIEKKHILDYSKVDVLIIPSLGNEFKIEQLELNEAIEFILSSNEYVQEFHQQEYVALISRLHKSNKIKNLEKVNILKELLKNSKLFSVSFNKNLKPTQNIKELYEHCFRK